MIPDLNKMDTHTLITPTSALIYSYIEPCAFETPTLDVTTAAKSEDNPFDTAFMTGLAKYAVHDPFAHSFGYTLKQEDIRESVQPLNPSSSITELYTNRPLPSLPLSIFELKDFYMTPQTVALNSPTEVAASQPEVDFESSTHYQDSAADLDIRILSALSSRSVSSTEPYRTIAPEQEELQVFAQRTQR